MARITVEDCVIVVPNRFELCLIASARAKNILSGSATELDRKEKPAVIALREIGDNLVDVEQIKQGILSSMRSRNSIAESNDNQNTGTTTEMIAEEMQNQEVNLVSENLQVDD